MDKNEIKLDNNGKQKAKKAPSPPKLKKKLPTKVKAILIIIVIVASLMIGTQIPGKLFSRETVIDFGFENVGKLVTQEWYGRIVEDSSKNRKIFHGISVPFTESRLIFSLDVEVLAAVDFEDIEYKVSNGKEKVIITLPHSKIYKAYEVNNSFISYLDDESWFTNINSTEQQKLKDKIVEKGEKQAIKSGVLKKADENAKRIIRHMIKENKSTKNFEVEFKYK